MVRFGDGKLVYVFVFIDFIVMGSTESKMKLSSELEVDDEVDPNELDLIIVVE